jgi:hypothetical protein
MTNELESDRAMVVNVEFKFLGPIDDHRDWHDGQVMSGQVYYPAEI